ncbi:UNVERIFIED_CONTAM: hypothetical protein FKN15_010177 [Acipenser sinensis]
MLRGMEKSLPPSSPSRQPISTDLLLHLIIALRQGCFNPFDDIVMETLCLIAFFGFLRCSEFSTPSTSSFPALGLKRSDLSQIPRNHFILHIRSSKTDQLSQGPGPFQPPHAVGRASTCRAVPDRAPLTTHFATRGVRHGNMDRNALAELLQALESRRDAEERRREERYTALIERYKPTATMC